MSRAIRFMMVIVGSLSLGLQGCDAFNDHPEEQDILSSMNLLPAAEEEGGSAAPSESATVCKVAEGVTASASDLQTIAANSGWSSPGEVTAAASGENATTITIASEGGTLAFTVQQQGEQSFSICNVSYHSTSTKRLYVGKEIFKHAGENHAESGAEEHFTLTGGSVMVEQFNVKSGSRVVNAGSYQFTFTPAANGAAKAIAALAGASAESPESQVVLQGTYYTDALVAAE